MQLRKTLHRTLLTLSAGVLLLSPLQAQEYDNRANVYGGLSYKMFDDDWNQHNETGQFFGGEIPVYERWGLSLEKWQANSTRKQIGGDTKFNYLRLGGNYHLDQVGEWQPYLGVGLGHNKLINDFPRYSDSETALDVGFGMKRFFGDNFFVRGDLKAIRVTNVNNTDLAFNLGVGYAFGPKPTRAVAAAPAPQPAPVQDVDSDGDGVPDSRDRCANTPRELAVDANGCPILETHQVSQDLLVNFDFDKAEIKAEFNDEIAEFAQFMTTYSNTRAVIEGHTDNTGPEEYNQGLSERRAQSVMNRLVEAHGIPASRLSAVGRGESRPLVSNDTPQNRARNRRIMAEVTAEVEEQVRR